MEIQVLRDTSTPHSITGKLSIDGAFQCFTIERPYGDTDFAPIPEGKYPVRMRESAFWQQHGYKMVPGIFDVPGRTDIEIHPGNTAFQSHGCIIVGNLRGIDSVFESRLAFDTLLEKIQKESNTIFITITKGDAIEKTA